MYSYLHHCSPLLSLISFFTVAAPASSRGKGKKGAKEKEVLQAAIPSYECVDDSDFTFGTSMSDVRVQFTQNCNWITKKPELVEQRRDNWCGRTHNPPDGPKIKEKCPVACDVCCKDDPDYSFDSYFWNGEDVIRNCAWIVSKESAAQNRKDNWCHQKRSGAYVHDKCAAACDMCG
jgi:hypothetical protein